MNITVKGPRLPIFGSGTMYYDIVRDDGSILHRHSFRDERDPEKLRLVLEDERKRAWDIGCAMMEREERAE